MKKAAKELQNYEKAHEGARRGQSGLAPPRQESELKNKYVSARRAGINPAIKAPC
ncbi:hypothetical protein SAMN05216316_2128 [Nitrosovibrio sp. Nv6]|nr:hypothetical protein SAMN05216316_2128 [Nitrosovibrio sp. Nv6]